VIAFAVKAEQRPFTGDSCYKLPGEWSVFRGSDLTDVSIIRRMPNIQTLSLRQVFANIDYKSCYVDGFWATVCKTVCPMLSDCCPSLSVSE